MKYIVYLTINLINHYIYIGQHNITGDGKDFYLGDGVYGNKPWTYKHPKYPFQYAVKKYGPKNFYRITLAEFDTLDEALFLEKILVNDKFLKRSDVYNVALGGGRGADTSKHIYQYNLQGDFITEFNSVREMERELGFNHSSVQNAVKYKSTSHGFLWSYEKYDKLDITEYCIYNKSQNIYLYTSDGNFYKYCNSIVEASKEINVPITRINVALTTKGLCAGYYISKEHLNKFVKAGKIEIKNKPIYQYDLSGKFIAEWKNIDDVCISLNVKKYSIKSAIRKHQNSCGYLWSVNKYDYIEPYKTQKKKVGIYKDGVLIEEFNSVKDFRKIHSSYEWTCLKSGSITKDGRLIKYLS